MKHFFVKSLRFCLIVVAVLSTTNSFAQKSDLKTDGLYNAEFFGHIYGGNFEKIKLKPEDILFLEFFDQYLRAYGEKCPSYLPKDKVKIMEQECAREEVVTNGFGVEVSRNCVEWKWVWSGLYARPDMYNAKLKVAEIQRQNSLRNIMELFSDPNSIGNSIDMVHKTRGFQMDMSRFIKMNSCNSEALRQFEKNFKLFALDKPAIRTKGDSKYAAIEKSEGPAGPQDFEKLIDDLVANQAKTWMFNRYTRGSISDVSILSRDDEGKPEIIKANYLFSGFNNSKGWVKIEFADGLPEGIYFWDYPENRKTPNSSIVAAYSQGKYSK